MKAVVDTNVVAYYLLGNAEFDAEVGRFWENVRDALAPAIWEAEIANVVFMSIRAGVLTKAGGPTKLHLARRLGIHTIATHALWHGALLRSVQSGVAVYDTLFVELAEREAVPLVTFDQRLLKYWPTIACRPSEVAGVGD
ncbi:MAG: PIN domain-containing protein [Lysobacterales bacterium]|nr:MAG: PIN domain-containing protein [Xanthomonadales bacterium]